jgi:hypothetical protein
VAQRYFWEQVRVETEGPLPQPVASTLAGKRHTIAEVLVTWPDYGFGNNPEKRPRWWQRHHRNYYHVRTSDEEVYEIYYDRGTSPKNPQLKKWYITRRL